MQDGVVKPICFASHVLLKQHRNYCTTRKELLAVVKFCRQFRHFLLGRFFLIRSYHNSLVWLTRFKHLEGQLARFLEELSQYNFKLIHRRGSYHNSLVWLTRFKHLEGQLARFLEELSQYNFKLIQRRGAEHINTDALNHIKDPLEECDCYSAGQKLRKLACGGCHYCTRAHKQWARFNDDVAPLAMHSVEAVMPDQAMPDQATSDQAMSGTQAFSKWMEGLSSQELRRAQIKDPNIGIVINWLEHSYEPTT